MKELSLLERQQSGALDASAHCRGALRSTDDEGVREQFVYLLRHEEELFAMITALCKRLREILDEAEYG